MHTTLAALALALASPTAQAEGAAVCGAQPLIAGATGLAASAVVVGPAIAATQRFVGEPIPYSTVTLSLGIILVAIPLAVVALVGVPSFVANACGEAHPWIRGIGTAFGYFVGAAAGLLPGVAVGAFVGYSMEPNGPTSLFSPGRSPPPWLAGAIIGAPIGALLLAPVGAGLGSWVGAGIGSWPAAPSEY